MGSSASRSRRSSSSAAPVGGPIAQGKTFFFIASEFQQGNKTVTVAYPVLDANSTPGQALLGVAPAEDLNAVSHGQSVITRIDHRISDATTCSAASTSRAPTRRTRRASAQQTGLGIASTANTAKSNLRLTTATNYTGMTQWNSVMLPRLVNELRVQMSREIRPRTYQGDGPQVTFGNTAVYSPRSPGSWGNVGFASEDNRYHFVDNFSIIGGAHSSSFNSVANWYNRVPTSYTQFTGTGDIDLTINHSGFSRRTSGA